MNERKWAVLSLAASLALAGLAIVFSQSLPYATVLIGIAALLATVSAIWSVWEWFPRILTDPEQAKATARSIYRCAARNGGMIHATHIFPVDRNPANDFAIEELGKAGTDVEIVFHRVLLLDSIEDERRWLTLLFSQLRENIAKRFYTLSSYPLLLPRIAKAVLPRLNLILYLSSQNRRCQVFVGLDRLHLIGMSVNFALHSRSQRVYRALLRYFDQITGGAHFRSCNSLKEYDAAQPASTQVQRGQAVVSKIVDCAETTPGIVFVGLFGSIARAALGLTADIVMENTDADVDLLVVFDPRIYPGTEDELRQHMEAALDVSRTHVTWGPDLSTFYPFRDEHRIDVDIECLPTGSSFYMENSLLGNSIFRYFMPLYSTDQRPIVSYVQVPMMPLIPVERWRRVVSDRQGLQYFKRRLAGISSATDPRRLCTHVLRNVVWAITGIWVITGTMAGQYLTELDEWKDKPELQDVIHVIGLSTQDIRRDLQKSFDVVETMLNVALEHAEIHKTAR